MRKRIVFRVKPNQGKWRVTRSDRPSCYDDFQVKENAVRFARRNARAERGYGFLSQLVIHLRDGTIETEHTYGRDPERRKG